MLRRDLTDLINSRRAWLFVGSGASVSSGYPTWEQLLRKTFRRLSADVKTAIRRSGKFERSMLAADYITAAGNLEAAAGRTTFLAAFRAELQTTTPAPNRITRTIANWPFEGYITSNYDDLVERAIEELDQRGWLSVGNTDSEIRKVSREPRELIWHVHGFLQHDRTQSELIVTARDYAQVYRDDSLYLKQLQALLAVKEIVFLGFGFNDAELRRVLETVGRLTPPTRPIRAILPDTISGHRRDELFRSCHIDPIVYHVDDNGSHEELHDLLQLHDSFILGRSQEYGNDNPPCEPFDEQTTGMLIYNELTLKRRAETGADVVRTMLQAKVLAKLNSKPCSFTELVEELEHLAAEVHTGFDALSPDFAFEAIQQLAKDGRITISEGGVVLLTPTGAAMVRDQHAISDRERDRLANCIYLRVKKEGTGLEDAQVRRIAQIVQDFFANSIRQRAIGVANALYSETFQDFSITTLLQSLATFKGRSASLDEARPLLRVIQEILLHPTDDERRVLGLMLQAQFAVHILGFDPATVTARLAEVKDTLYIFDSYYLLHYLAVASPGFRLTQALVAALTATGAALVTTGDLVAEVTGQVCRALADQRGVDPQSITSYKNATGRAGRSEQNPFNVGYVVQQSRGNAGVSFDQYVANICKLPVRNTRGASSVVKATLQNCGILVRDLRDYTGYATAMREEVDASAARLTVRRREHATFTGPRQTDAEAEALTIIHNIRKKLLALDGRKFANAYFVSTTNLVSAVGVERHANIRAEPLLQTVAMLRSWTIDEMTILADTMLAEISERNLIVLPPEKVQFVFNPLRVSSRRQIDSVLAEYRDLVAERFGGPEVQRLATFNGLDLPLVAERLTSQLIAVMRTEQDRIKRLEAESQKAKLTITERREYERLKNKEREKRKKNAARKQAGRGGPHPPRPKPRGRRRRAS